MFEEIKPKLMKRTLFELVKFVELKAPQTYAGIYVVQGSIKRWIDTQSFFTRWYWKYKYSFMRMVKKLDPLEINELTKAVFILEELDVDKKKVMEK